LGEKKKESERTAVTGDPSSPNCGDRPVGVAFAGGKRSACESPRSRPGTEGHMRVKMILIISERSNPAKIVAKKYLEKEGKVRKKPVAKRRDD